MKKQQQLSPEKYIKTKARSLPIYKCWVNSGWEEAGMANVIIARQHINQNLTAGIYLVDLMCLGIKDTFYFFNEPKQDILKKLPLENGSFIEIDYALAHNIIYSGYDFALEYDINPHKDFAVTKNILEEDTEAIPLIDISTGDEEGRPRLVVDAGYNYKPVLEKLKKNAGEGNYSFIIGNAWDEDEDEDENEEEDWDEENWLNEIETDYIDFNDVHAALDAELEEVYEDETRSLSDQEIVYSEQMLRMLDEREAGWRMDEVEVMNMPEWRRYTEKISLHEKEYDSSTALIESVRHELNAIIETKSTNNEKNDLYFALFKKYAQNEMAGFAVLNAMPSISTLLHIEYLRQNTKEFPPLVQLFIAAFSLSLQKEMFEQDFDYITNAVVVQDAFSSDSQLHALHEKLFWVVKAVHAMNHNDKQQVLRYHSLLGITGIGGRLKSVYVISFNLWLKQYV